MLKLIALIIAFVLWFIWLIKQSKKEEEIYYKRMQEIIKNAVKDALNEREEEFINDDDFGPFEDEEENLDDYEHLEEKRKAVEETIDSIVDVID